MQLRFLSTFVLLAGALVPFAASQKESAKAKHGADSTPVFRSSTSLVTVNVVVTDRYHQPVRGLTAKDFSLLEDGKAQDIGFFEPHSPLQKLPETPALELPANQFTNFHNSETGGVVNIVLFDMLNTAPMDQVYARHQLLQFLETIPPGQPIALFTLGSRLRMIQGFTTDVQTLLEAANRLRPGMSSLMASGDMKLSDLQSDVQLGMNQPQLGMSVSPFEDAIAQENALRTGYRVGMTVNAIGAISRAVSGYSGRKNLLWLSAGFPISVGPDLEMRGPLQHIESYQEEVNKLGIVLASSQMAVYPIDVRGLVVNAYDASAHQTQKGIPDMSWLWNTQSTMRDIAEQTGGEAFYNTNGIREAMSKAVERGSHYYTLQYAPKNRDWNGKHRSIKVRLNNGTGYHLEYRSGYLALPQKEITGSTPLQLLSEAMQPGLPDATMLTLKAQVLPPDSEYPTVRIDYAVFPDQLTYSDLPGQGRAASVDFAVIAWDITGKQVALQLQSAERQPHPGNSRLGLVTHQDLRLKPGKYVLKLGAIDLASQKIGTLEVPLVVPETQSPNILMQREQKPQ